VKIEKSMQPITGVSVNDGQRRVDKAKGADASSSPAENNVHISPQSSQLQRAESSASSSSVVNAGRVQEIKQAINDGSFRVNPEVVADRLLETVRELINSKKSDA
jgi:negative regulator of flagellin synthesis FlgM